MKVKYIENPNENVYNDIGKKGKINKQTNFVGIILVAGKNDRDKKMISDIKNYGIKIVIDSDHNNGNVKLITKNII